MVFEATNVRSCLLYPCSVAFSIAVIVIVAVAVAGGGGNDCRGSS